MSHHNRSKSVKPAVKISEAVDDILLPHHTEATVVIPSGAMLREYDLVTLYWEDHAGKRSGCSYPLPVTAAHAGKAFSYRLASDVINGHRGQTLRIWYTVQQVGSKETEISYALDLQLAKNSPVSDIAYAKIHPALGLARVGNSPDEFYIGPEYANAPPPAFGSTRDATGAIKRQAARFRIYGYNQQGEAIAELTPDIADIQWTVEVANKKSAWYQFDAAMDQETAVPVKRRNPLITGEARKTLEIRPTAKSISGINTCGVQFDDGKFKDVTVNLGELRTDEKGRLLVLGGHGVAASPSGAPLLQFDENGKELNFNNSVDWYDDTSDGPVTAKVTINGSDIPVTGAWVAVGPPDYAPGIMPFRSLFDLVKHAAINAGMVEPDAETSFTKHILPLLLRLANLQWVNLGFAQTFGPGGAYPITSELICKLAQPGNDQLRFDIYEKFRSPEDASVDGGVEMKWPQLYGDGFAGKYPSKKGDLLAVAPYSYKHLANFVLGNFINDLDPTALPQYPELGVSRPVDELPVADQPAILDEGPLSWCCADAFHPGCELTWPMRHVSMFSEFTRIKRREPGQCEKDFGDELTPAQAVAADGPLHAQGPGDLTRWMAMPWQGDTARCRSGYDKEFHPYMPSFWPARVPNEVFTEENYAIFSDTTLSDRERDEAFQQRDHWQRLFLLDGLSNEEVMQNTVARFDELGIVQRLPAPEGYTEKLASVYVEQLKPGHPPLPEQAKAFGGRVDGKETERKAELLEEAGWSEEQWDHFRRNM